jgi:uncharacterized membrane protein YhiD involved in acid resistance
MCQAFPGGGPDCFGHRPHRRRRHFHATQRGIRDLTTAASAWLTAALGMACGAGLPVLAVAAMIIHLIIMLGFPTLAKYVPQEKHAAARVRISSQIELLALGDISLGRNVEDRALLGQHATA